MLTSPHDRYPRLNHDVLATEHGGSCSLYIPRVLRIDSMCDDVIVYTSKTTTTSLTLDCPLSYCASKGLCTLWGSALGLFSSPGTLFKGISWKQIYIEDTAGLGWLKLPVLSASFWALTLTCPPHILTVANPHAVAAIEMINRIPATKDDPKKLE
jgi:hypothetical protein